MVRVLQVVSMWEIEVGAEKRDMESSKKRLPYQAADNHHSKNNPTEMSQEGYARHHERDHDKQHPRIQLGGHVEETED